MLMPVEQPEPASHWVSSAAGILSHSIGPWGHRIRVFQKRAGGPFYASAYRPNGTRRVRSLGTGDPAMALQLARDDLAASDARSCCRVPLGQLWHRYRDECETFRDTDSTHQSDTATRAAVLIAHFGPDFDVARLTRDRQRRYERARAAGGIRYSRARRIVHGGRTRLETVWHVTPPTRARSAEADLVLLHAMLNWATTVCGGDGKPWLTHNPLKGVERQPEKNPWRPVTCEERYVATRQAIQRRIARTANGTPEQLRWIRLELALVLAETTGRRLGAIRQLRWEDIDYARSAITWRADGDKMGVLWTVDMPTRLVSELKQFQARLAGVGGWVFPAERLPDQPMDRWLFERWLLVAESDAKLPKLVGGVWHPYRRKWAMERKQWPIRDVAAVGGWKSHRSLLECYAQADRETMLGVANESRKLQARDLAPGQLVTREPWSPPPQSRATRPRAVRPVQRPGELWRRCSPVSHARRRHGANVAPAVPKAAPPPRN